jgi:hypothetical protein
MGSEVQRFKYSKVQREGFAFEELNRGRCQRADTIRIRDLRGFCQELLWLILRVHHCDFTMDKLWSQLRTLRRKKKKSDPPKGSTRKDLLERERERKPRAQASAVPTNPPPTITTSWAAVKDLNISVPFPQKELCSKGKKRKGKEGGVTLVGFSLQPLLQNNNNVLLLSEKERRWPGSLFNPCS